MIYNKHQEILNTLEAFQYNQELENTDMLELREEKTLDHGEKYYGFWQLKIT